MFEWLKIMFNPDIKIASKEAAKFFQEAYSDRKVIDVCLRSIEEERFIFAVFYKGAEIVKPPRYEIIGVNKNTLRCEGLVVSPESPYFIRGRK